MGGAGEHGANVDAAIRGLAARLQQQPGDVEGWTLLARAYGATGRPAQARGAFGKALQLAPDNAELHVEYGQFLAETDPQHRIAGEALAQIETALSRTRTTSARCGCVARVSSRPTTSRPPPRRGATS
ncbi:MAG: tetratricopeptide repeat protein [Lysobacterales bacterium]